MSYDTFREKDMRQEAILSDYLDDKLYNQPIFENFKRTKDLQSQYDGSDLTISIPTKNINHIVVDEKAQLYYLDGGLPTFAFELNFVTRAAQRVEGWFTDSSKKTEYYNLLFLTAEKNFTNPNQIAKVEYILVSRKAIFDFLNQQGLSIEKLRALGNEVSKNTDFYQHKKTGVPYYFTHSTKLAESPVNIILRKELLMKICCLHGVV